MLKLYNNDTSPPPQSTFGSKAVKIERSSRKNATEFQKTGRKLQFLVIELKIRWDLTAATMPFMFEGQPKIKQPWFFWLGASLSCHNVAKYRAEAVTIWPDMIRIKNIAV